MAQGRKEALSVQALQFADAGLVYLAFVISAAVRDDLLHRSSRHAAPVLQAFVGVGGGPIGAGLFQARHAEVRDPVFPRGHPRPCVRVRGFVGELHDDRRTALPVSYTHLTLPTKE